MRILQFFNDYTKYSYFYDLMNFRWSWFDVYEDYKIFKKILYFHTLVVFMIVITFKIDFI